MSRSLLALSLACLSLPFGAGCALTPAPPVSESFVETDDGALLFYRKVGDEGPVLIVPNASWCAADTADLAHGRTVLYYDPRGRGRSSRLPETAAPTLERDLADLENLRSWFGVERCDLLGFDYQAALAAHYAARHPERVEHVVLVSPVPPRRTPYLQIYERVFSDRLDPEAYKHLEQMRVEQIHITDPERWAEAYARALFVAWFADPRAFDRVQSRPFVSPNLPPEHLFRQYERMLVALGEWDWRPVAARVRAPALVIWGATDPVPAESSREWAATFPNGSTHVVDDSGRLPWIERPREFFAEVDAFLAR